MQTKMTKHTLTVLFGATYAYRLDEHTKGKNWYSMYLPRLFTIGIGSEYGVILSHDVKRASNHLISVFNM